MLALLRARRREGRSSHRRHSAAHVDRLEEVGLTASSRTARSRRRCGPTSRTQPPAPTAGSATMVARSPISGASPRARASPGFRRTRAPSRAGASASARSIASRPGEDESSSSRARTASAIRNASSVAARCEPPPLDFEGTLGLFERPSERGEGGDLLVVGAPAAAGLGRDPCLVEARGVSLSPSTLGGASRPRTSKAASSTGTGSGRTTESESVCSRMIEESAITRARRSGVR